ncbi:ankyrin repeat domain-containing protein [Wolbachia endosymbiont of Armadillidium arcangelii]|uniref:Ankyrin repeat domain-containing protein n=1 Tax=Wolbachia endosymbiont of Armadillidium arcangelii TaxID=3158571 RepID=A0AAU7Q1S7_9RICK
MSIDLSVLVTNANKLDKYINKNKKQDKKDKQLYDTIERKVKKAQHKRERPRSRDRTLKKCKRLFEEGASPEVLIKLKESFREREKYYKYYTKCFLPVLDKVIKQSKKISNETKEQVISEVTKSHSNKNRKDSESESGYGSDFEDEVNEITDNDAQLLKAIKNGNNRKFRKYLKNCINVSGIKDEKGNNILHLIVSLEKKQKYKFLSTLKKTIPEEDLAQLVDSKKQNALQVALINKITKEEHKSNTIRSSDNTLKFLMKFPEHVAKISLSTDTLKKLSKKQNEYHLKFLKKLAELKPEAKTEVEEVIAHAINTPDSNDNYQLHLAIKNKDEKSFKELLKEGADISLKDTNGNNVLHLIVTKLDKGQKLKFLNIILNISKKKEKGQLKTQLTEAINAENTAKQTPLHQLLQYIRKKSESQSLTDKEFKGTTRYQVLKLFLQNGADITAQDKEGNNILHHIALLKGEQKITCLELISDKDDAVNTTNREGLTPIHYLFQHIKEKNEDRSYTDRKFEKTNRYKALELFLQNGTDITAQDKEGNNILHHIALLKGEQKISCLNLILDLVKKGVISKDKLGEAVNATNEKKRTPLQVALITKTTKDKHNLINPKSRDNTIKFCVKLLQNGVDPKQILPKRLWSKEYYKIIKGIEKSIGRKLIPDNMRTELKCNFGKKLKARDIVKYVNNGVCKVVTTLVFTALACTVIFSASQGSITIAAASSIIAVIGVCYLIYLNLENIYEGFGKIKGKLTEEKQLTLQDNAPKNDTQCNHSVKDIENKSNDLEEQEVQKSSNQSEHTESPPDTKMSAISIMNSLKNCDRDSVTNKPSSLER